MLIWSNFQRFRGTYYMGPSPNCMLPNLVAPNHFRFYFLIRISLFPKYKHIIPPFPDWYTNQVFFYLTSPTLTLVFSPVIMHFTISFPVSLFLASESVSPSVPLFQHLLIYPIKMTRNYDKQTSHLYSTSSGEFEECLNKAGAYT